VYERDGRFRVAFAEKSKSGWLVIEARQPVPRPNVRWKRGAEHGEPIVLEPKLGGCIAGHVIPPAGVTPDEVSGQVLVHQTRSTGVGSTSTQRAALDVGRELVFEARGLAPEDGYRLVFQGASLVSGEVAAEVEPGATKAVEIPLERGAVLAGRVVDEARPGDREGAPDDARRGRAADLPRLPPRDEWTGRDVPTRGPVAGKTTLIAQADGYESLRRSVGTLAAGDVHEALELVLARGNSIAGRVQWADGTPAANAALEIASEGRENFDGFAAGSRAMAKSAEDGSFRVMGLGEGPFQVKANAKRSEEVSEWTRSSGASARTSRPCGTARAPSTS
jgi:hypothetical protein